MFKSGFAWVKIDGCSYMCKILNRNEDESLFEIEIGNTIFTDVPVSVLQSVNGDE